MTSFSRDPIVNAVYGGMKADIAFNLEHRHYLAVITLTLASIDAMAYVGAPSGQADVTGPDFVAWAERYLPIVNRKPLTGLDLYGARCAVLHQYGARSKLSREGKCRLIGWADKMMPPVQIGSAPAALVGPSQEMIMVSVSALAQSFFDGIDRFMIEAFATPPDRQAVTEQRLRDLNQMFPYPKPGAGKERG